MNPRGVDRAGEGPTGSPSGLTATVVRGTGISGVAYLITQALTLGSYLILARLATPEEFGQLAAGSILVSVGILLSESGMLAALVHRRDRLEEAAATAVIATFAAGSGLALLAFAASPIVGSFFGSDQIASVAAATSGLLFLRAIPVVPTALLQRRFSFLRRVVVEPAGAIAFGVTAIVATAEGLGVWGLVLGFYAHAVTDVILSWVLARWRPRLRRASFQMWRELVGYGRHVFTATAVLRIGGEVPVALLGRFVGASPLGQYRYANRIAATPFAVILAAASSVLFPAFARISTERERFRGAFVRALRWMATIGIPSGLILLPLGHPIAMLVFGKTWSDAGWAVMALCLLPAAGAIISVVSEVFKADGRPELLTRMHLLETGLGAAAMVALLPFGLIGVAAGISVGATGGAIYALHRVHVVLDLPIRSILREVAPPLAAAVLMAGCLLPVELLLVDAAGHDTGLGLALVAAEAASGLLAYGLCLHLLVPGQTRELTDLLRLGLRRGERGAGGERPRSIAEGPLEQPGTAS
jgi:PST family polysaccharide transporter